MTESRNGRGGKRYDRAYFDKWYRESGRVTTPANVERKVRMVVGMAEFLLGRRVRSVLDIGCGEGVWQPVLQRLLPGSRYAGVDSSAYVVERFGKRRNIRLGAFGDLDELGLADRYDLIVCCDVLHYLPRAELLSGLPAISRRLEGLAYLEAYTRSDDIAGDMDGFVRRTPAAYRRLLHEAGLRPIGMQCYVHRETGPWLTALEVQPTAAKP